MTPDDDGCTRGPERAAAPKPAAPPLLPDRAKEDDAESWGERGPQTTQEWYEAQRPPHWE